MDSPRHQLCKSGELHLPNVEPSEGSEQRLDLVTDAAWLATQMFKPASQNTNITEGYLAYALWSLFNPNALTGVSPSQQSSVEACLNSIPARINSEPVRQFLHLHARHDQVDHVWRRNLPDRTSAGVSRLHGTRRWPGVAVSAAGCSLMLRWDRSTSSAGERCSTRAHVSALLSGANAGEARCGCGWRCWQATPTTWIDLECGRCFHWP